MFDVRVAGVVITLWGYAVVILMLSFGFTRSAFFRFGPGETIHFFGNPVNTWARYCGLCFYVIVQQLVQTYGLETITPYMINQVQNRRVKTLEERQSTVLSIILLWYTYLWIGRIISIQILLSQFDLLVLVLAVDLLTTFVVTRFYYLANKRTGVMHLEDVDPEKGNGGGGDGCGNDTDALLGSVQIRKQ